MALPGTKNGPFRVFGLYRSTGKHAAPRGTVPRTAARSQRRGAHAVSLPRLTSPRGGREKAA